MTVQTAQYVSSRNIFTSARFALCEETFATSDGQVVRPVIHHPGAVAILAQPSQDTVLLVRQYRYPIRRWTLEIPAGTRVAGEAAVMTAGRELQEEAGYRADSLQEVMRFYPAVGVSDEELIIYRASGLHEIPASPEHGELVARAVVPIAQLRQLCASGELCDAKTLLAMGMLGIAPCDRALGADRTHG
jgi:ADP-ribose pyrophosphatase